MKERIFTLEELDKSEFYRFVADEDELRWFYDHCVFHPKTNEVYAFCLSSRNKKLTDDERKGMPSGRSEMMHPNIVHASAEGEFTYEGWKKGIRLYEAHKESMTNRNGDPFLAKTLVVYMAINPCDEIGAIKSLKNYINIHEQELVDSAMKNNSNVALINEVLDAIKDDDNDKITLLKERIVNSANKCQTSGVEQSLYKLSRSLTKFKRLQFDNVGTKYWVDFDMDLKKEVRGTRNEEIIIKLWMDYLNQKFNKGNFVCIKTGGGVHTLIRKEKIKFNPNWFIEEFLHYVNTGIEVSSHSVNNETAVPYTNVFVKGEQKNYTFSELAKENVESVKGNMNMWYNWLQLPSINNQETLYYTPASFIDELIYNNNSMTPVPGTYMYGNVVRVLNKKDFK